MRPIKILRIQDGRRAAILKIALAITQQPIVQFQ